jgi:hypothetical protein
MARLDLSFRFSQDAFGIFDATHHGSHTTQLLDDGEEHLLFFLQGIAWRFDLERDEHPITAEADQISGADTETGLDHTGTGPEDDATPGRATLNSANPRTTRLVPPEAEIGAGAMTRKDFVGENLTG